MKRNIGIFSAILLGGAVMAQAGEGVDVGGYVDAQYNWAMVEGKNGKSGSGGEASANTFRLNEGAVYLGKKMGGAEVMIDLDIAGPAKSTYNGFQSGVTSSALTVGGAKSQAYVGMNYDNGFGWRMGQFDSLYGFEANDTADLRFAEHGILYDVMPVTHVGLHVSYDLSDMMDIHFLVANPYDQGHIKNGNPDFGLKLNTNFDSFSFNLGALVSTGDHGGNGYKKQAGYLVDADLSAHFGSTHGVLYGYFKKADHDGAKSDFGVGLEVAMAATEMIDFGVRAELDIDGTDNKATTAAGVSNANGDADDQTWEVTVGPQFKVADGFMVKVDYTYKATSWDASGVEDQNKHLGNVAGVYKF